MSTRMLSVFWKGQLVGTILHPVSDHFDLHGKWMPSEGEATMNFLKALGAGEQLEVAVGELEPHIRGTVEEVPEEQIDIRCRP